MMQESRANSYLFGGNAPYVEELYEAYLDNPGSVPDKWRAYFDALQHVPAVDGSSANFARAARYSRARRATSSAAGTTAPIAPIPWPQPQTSFHALRAAESPPKFILLGSLSGNWSGSRPAFLIEPFR